MAYNVTYKKSVQRDLKHLPKSEAKRILDQIEQELVKDPESNPSLKGQFAGLRKYRVGNYRIIYSLLGKEIRILRIGHRGIYINAKSNEPRDSMIIPTNLPGKNSPITPKKIFLMILL